MNSPTIERETVEVLATEFVARWRHGEFPSVEEYVTRYPELAEELQSMLPTILALEKLKIDATRNADGRVSLAGSKLDQLGDFRIVRELGRGGMGIVYEAEQLSLSRRVALKVLPRQSLIEPRYLQRFEREAQTAAGLHHTNIVQVFGVGHQDGFHYYVMQLIEGVSLDRVIDSLRNNPSYRHYEVQQLVKKLSEAQSNKDHQSLANTASIRGDDTGPSNVTEQASHDGEPIDADHDNKLTTSPKLFWNNVAQIGIQVAGALQYAHTKGTLHRDIKPANLVIDAQGVCWVADFGLAKALENADVSQTGDLIGTLAYMAPEQFNGSSDHRSDIYSLGLTLYELMTGRPAFQDTDNAKLLNKIVNSEAVPPRQISADVPRDLETIVLKAISTDPQRRYQSAADLEADLHCFLEDRPIAARRVSLAEQFWRWCRRNPTVAALTVVASLLLLTVASMASFGFAQTRRALAGERKQRERAEAASEVAVQVLDRVYERLAPPQHFAAKEWYPIQLSEGSAAMLEDMLVFYDSLAAADESGTTYRDEIALANRRVGDIRHHLGQIPRATEAYERALSLFQESDQDANGDTTHLIQLASLQIALGIMYERQGKSDRARASFQSAIDAASRGIDSGSENAKAFENHIARAEDHIRWIDDPPDFADRPPEAPLLGPQGGRRDEYRSGPPPRREGPPFRHPDGPPRDWGFRDEPPPRGAPFGRSE